jgi:hypothetical protein
MTKIKTLDEAKELYTPRGKILFERVLPDLFVSFNRELSLALSEGRTELTIEKKDVPSDATDLLINEIKKAGYDINVGTLKLRVSGWAVD